MSTVVHRGRWDRDDRAAGIWPELPFEVPPGCTGVSVELEFDRGDGAVLDLGCEGAAGWRGWSGGARQSFVITPDAATPGYLPGELEAGEWSVVLGLHRLPADGVGYQVRVTLGPATVPRPPGVAGDGWPPVPPEAERPTARSLPSAPGLRWLACDFHAHTVHSDGSLTVAELAARAAGRGLDVLAVTDHNTVSHHAELAAVSAHYGVLLVPGQEVTTDTGHANVFGTVPWIDFREPAEQWLAATERAGGALSVNHPLAGDCSWLRPLDPRPPLAEVWHYSWLDPRWGGPVAWWRGAGLGIAPVGGSDFHRPNQIAELGKPVTWVAVPAGAADGASHPDAVAAVVDGLRAGRTAVSADIAVPDCPALVRAGDELIAVAADGALLLSPDGSRHPVRSPRASFPAGDGGHVLIAPDGAVLALSA